MNGSLTTCRHQGLSEIVHGDITDPQSLKGHLHGVDTVISCIGTNSMVRTMHCMSSPVLRPRSENGDRLSPFGGGHIRSHFVRHLLPWY